MNRFIPIFLFCCILSIPGFAMQDTLFLTENWQFKEINADQWNSAKVPGVVHLDLLDNGLIPDPFWRTTEKDLVWIEETHWVYQTKFDFPHAFDQKEVFLNFAGLDTYAEVFINGILLGETDNMFRFWKWEVSDKLKKEGNVLRVIFYSPIKKNEEKLDGIPYHLTAGNDASDKKISVYTRKAPFQFGWDWGPRMVTCGIWKPVFLTIRPTEEIKQIQFFTRALTDEKALLSAKIGYWNQNETELTFRVVNKESGQVYAERKRVGDPSIHKTLHLNTAITLDWQIDNPKLWWTHNLGDPHLYQFRIEILKDGVVVDTKEIKYGIRTIELVQEKTRKGESFYFKLNGVPVFMKGANYVPPDIFLARTGSDQYLSLLEKAKAANMNMLRVWGGGIYEDDAFYTLCDEMGILVWQDFMFACSMYPSDQVFWENVEQEIRENVRRLHNHPSLILWCGNNEIDVAWHNWGWQEQHQISEEDSSVMWQAYLNLFHRWIPNILKRSNQGRPYVSTSPLSNWGTPRNFNVGSMHYWGVWHGREPFENYWTNVGRFMSEYGFQSFPSIQTIETFAKPEDLSIDSEVMQHRQKSYVGTGLIKEHMERYFSEPTDFTDFVLKSQLVQMEGMRNAIYAHRSKKGHCWGTLFWQLNDTWPGPSWSAIDYHGRKKAFYYKLKNWYGNRMIVPKVEENHVTLFLVSDELFNRKGILEIGVYTIEGEKIWGMQFNTEMKANQSYRIKKIRYPQKVLAKGRDQIYFRMEFKDEDSIFASNHFTLLPPKEMKYGEPKIRIEHNPSGQEYILSSETFCEYIYLRSEGELEWENNFITLFPGEKKVVSYKNDPPEGIKSLYWKMLK